eukprot:TRINITY_DN17296_c0_g1_i6.p1 TRINITY_DN17296_c0_g1~~TRINITY_DN17296_c0_g1_i6.p1  ORF type:complete len:780 (-),score=131.22 TRINITY_DN17296_c0_g1_i6:83-2338(-)
MAMESTRQSPPSVHSAPSLVAEVKDQVVGAGEALLDDETQPEDENQLLDVRKNALVNEISAQPLNDGNATVKEKVVGLSEPLLDAERPLKDDSRLLDVRKTALVNDNSAKPLHDDNGTGDEGCAPPPRPRARRRVSLWRSRRRHTDVDVEAAALGLAVQVRLALARGPGVAMLAEAGDGDVTRSVKRQLGCSTEIAKDAVRRATDLLANAGVRRRAKPTHPWRMEYVSNRGSRAHDGALARDVRARGGADCNDSDGGDCKSSTSSSRGRRAAETAAAARAGRPDRDEQGACHSLVSVPSGGSTPASCAGDQCMHGFLGHGRAAADDVLSVSSASSSGSRGSRSRVLRRPAATTSTASAAADVAGYVEAKKTGVGTESQRRTGKPTGAVGRKRARASTNSVDDPSWQYAQFTSASSSASAYASESRPASASPCSALRLLCTPPRAVVPPRSLSRLVDGDGAEALGPRADVPASMQRKRRRWKKSALIRWSMAEALVAETAAEQHALGEGHDAEARMLTTPRRRSSRSLATPQSDANNATPPSVSTSQVSQRAGPEPEPEPSEPAASKTNDSSELASMVAETAPHPRVEEAISVTPSFPPQVVETEHASPVRRRTSEQDVTRPTSPSSGMQPVDSDLVGTTSPTSRSESGPAEPSSRVSSIAAATEKDAASAGSAADTTSPRLTSGSAASTADFWTPPPASPPIPQPTPPRPTRIAQRDQGRLFVRQRCCASPYQHPASMCKGYASDVVRLPS